MPWIIGGLALAGGVAGAAGSASAASKQQGAAESASAVTRGIYDQTRKDLSPYRYSGEQANIKLSELLGLGGGVNESSPEFQQLYNQKLEQFNQNHLRNYGVDIYGPQADQSGVQDTMDLIRRQVADELRGKGLGSSDYGSLLKQFGMQDFQESPAYQFNLQQGMEAINKSAAAKGKYYAPATLQDIGKYSQGLASNEFQNAFNNYRTGQNDIWSRLSGMSGQGLNAATQTGQFGANAANQIGQNTIGGGNAAAAGIVGQTNAITGAAGDAYNNYLLSQVLGQKQSPTYGV